MNLKRKSRKKPWITSRQGRNRRNAKTDELIKPFHGKLSNNDWLYKSSEWKAVREIVLHRDGVCQWCLHLARITEATEADHIIPVDRCEREGVSPYDQTNIVGSCRSCNSRRASYEAKGISYNTFDEWVNFLRRKIIDKAK